MVVDEGLEDEVRKLNTMPFLLRAFISSNSERTMNNLIHTIIGFCSKDSYYGDSEPLKRHPPNSKRRIYYRGLFII